MSPFTKFGLITGLVLVLLLVGFVYLPLPGLSVSNPAQADSGAIEERGMKYFEMIEEGQNLDRPFPEMMIRADNPMTEASIELGRMLFFDPILSADNTVSCATCHHPDLGFSDNRERSMGVGGRGLGRDRDGGATIRRNSPTVWNAAFSHVQFWDGRAKDLEEQAAGPIQDPKEMGQNPDLLVEELSAIPAYVSLFEEAYGASDATITFERVTHAIANFERTIISQNSRYDQFAAGDRQALSMKERRGLNVFRSLKTRCFECHNVPTFANPDFKVIGVPDLEGQDPDLGRGEIVGEGYELAFKVPTLRNVALTAPYMHNGVFETLEEVIDFYAKGGGTGLGLDIPNIDDKMREFTLSDQEKQDLIAFLHALTDESQKPEIPTRVPSGYPVVPHLANQSPEMEAFTPEPITERTISVPREGKRLTVDAGMRIQDAIDVAMPGDTVWVRPGVYHETLSLDISELTLIGEHSDAGRAVLDGKGELSDGMVGSGSNIVIEGFEVRNYTSNGLMIDLATDITFRDLWLEDTGLYGLYPVEVVGVLIEGSTVIGARDAGIYVGQSKDILVRNNTTYGNVTGIEIENSVDAIVEYNEVYDNAGGILVFLLPNNPSKISQRCIVRNNNVYENNHVNFADPNAIVSSVPSGTGIMILAADEVEVTENRIEDNKSVGIAVVGLASLYDEGTLFDVDPTPEANRIYGNTMARNGLDPDQKVYDAGFDGADLVWDLSGYDNSWDQPGVTRLPYALPGSNWSNFRRRVNYRIWKAAIAVM